MRSLMSSTTIASDTSLRISIGEGAISIGSSGLAPATAKEEAMLAYPSSRASVGIRLKFIGMPRASGDMKK